MGAVARGVFRRRQRFVGEKGAPARGVKRPREVRPCGSLAFDNRSTEPRGRTG
jgi:hypothetical protein